MMFFPFSSMMTVTFGFPVSGFFLVCHTPTKPEAWPTLSPTRQKIAMLVFRHWDRRASSKVSDVLAVLVLELKHIFRGQYVFILWNWFSLIKVRVPGANSHNRVCLIGSTFMSGFAGGNKYFAGTANCKDW